MFKFIVVLSVLVGFPGSLQHSIPDEQETASIGLLEKIVQQFDDAASIFRALREEPDLNMGPVEMIEFRGFNAEVHHAITEDCYILELHRIVNPHDNTPNKPPVLLQHGFPDSSTGWMVNSVGGNVDDNDDRNLAFALAKRGYDVWLGNFRGNTYSRNHTTFSPNEPSFWKFTFDNYALQDLPAEIGYIQKKTDHDQVAVVAYSLSTMTMFQLLSFKPEVANAIRPYIALAPVACLSSTGPIKFLSKFILKTLLSKNREFLANSKFSHGVSRLCLLFPNLLCKNLIHAFIGSSRNQLNSTRTQVYFKNLPAGTSLANIVHLTSNRKSERVELLDYSDDKQNLDCYNSTQAPLIPLENIQLEDLYLMNAQNDILTTPSDVEKLKQRLTVNYHARTIKDFTHVDFVLSTESDIYVNNWVIEVLKEKAPKSKSLGKTSSRLYSFDEATCTPPAKDARCYLDLGRVLNRILA